MQPQKKNIVNWNDFSSDQNDSWINSDSESEDQNTQTNKASTTQQTVKVDKNQTGQKTEQKTEQHKKQHKKQSKQESMKNKPQYPSDQDILNSFENNQIEQDKTLKVLRCFNANQLEFIKSNKSIIRRHEFKQNCYILGFESKGDLIKFINQKIQKKYRFKLGIFIKSTNPKRDKYQKRDKNKQSYQQKKYQDKKREYRQKNEDNRQYNKQNDKYKHHKDDRKPKEKDNFELQKDSNIVKIFSDKGEPEKIVNLLKKKQLKKNFSRIILTIKAKYLQYAQQVIYLCHKQLDFGLDGKINQQDYENKLEEIIEISIKEKLPYTKINLQISQLSDKVELYFKKCQQKNEYQIGPKEQQTQVNFNQKQYYQQFKKNYATISKKWKIWVLKAYNQNIQKLLKLNWIFVKGLPKHNIKLQVGQDNNIPFTKLIIGSLDEQIPKVRGKPDTSAVHNHLNA